MAGWNFRLALAVLLAVLSCCSRAQDGHHSLRYELNITSNNQARCVSQGWMDRMDLLLCDCDNNEVKYVNTMLKGTQTLEDMIPKLKEMGDLMREKLPNITPENYTKRDSSVLQVRLMCQCDANRSCSGSLELGFNGRRFLVFDSETREYKVDNPRDELMKEKWKNDDDVTECFKVFLKGDCKKWLKFLACRKKELETTAAPTMATASTSPPTVSATPTTAPAKAPVPSKAVIISHNNIALILTGIFILITLGIQAGSFTEQDAAPKLLTVGLVPHVSLLVGHLSVISSGWSLQDLLTSRSCSPPGAAALTASRRSWCYSGCNVPVIYSVEVTWS